jgi:hypothetical protein
VSWDDDELDRKADRSGLIFDELSANTVHGNAVVCLADAGDQLRDVDIRVSLANVMERQGGVLATAPEKGRQSRRLHDVHRWFGQEKQFSKEKTCLLLRTRRLLTTLENVVITELPA